MIHLKLFELYWTFKKNSSLSKEVSIQSKRSYNYSKKKKKIAISIHFKMYHTQK